MAADRRVHSVVGRGAGDRPWPAHADRSTGTTAGRTRTTARRPGRPPRPRRQRAPGARRTGRRTAVRRAG